MKDAASIPTLGLGRAKLFETGCFEFGDVCSTDISASEVAPAPEASLCIDMFALCTRSLYSS